MRIPSTSMSKLQGPPLCCDYLLVRVEALGARVRSEADMVCRQSLRWMLGVHVEGGYEVLDVWMDPPMEASSWSWLLRLASLRDRGVENISAITGRCPDLPPQVLETLFPGAMLLPHSWGMAGVKTRGSNGAKADSQECLDGQTGLRRDLAAVLSERLLTALARSGQVAQRFQRSADRALAARGPLSWREVERGAASGFVREALARAQRRQEARATAKLATAANAAAIAQSAQDAHPTTAA